ncbi:jg17712 [Pararge aegeria aegeria]|uniref:Jg17712 protein n=1 Tax=Pararge aegeria aegeria TaxID=348720 RepID=A0A8S4QIL9_9NEOP|nr:jg17712 [Pararge aegeria aegeria]
MLCKVMYIQHTNRIVRVIKCSLVLRLFLSRCKKTSCCLTLYLHAEKSSFTLAHTFRGVSVPIGDHIELSGVNISSPSSNLNFGKCIESKAKVAAKRLGILNKVRRYFTPGQRLALYQVQVRTSMEYCSHPWGGSAKFQLEAFDSVDHTGETT